MKLACFEGIFGRLAILTRDDVGGVPVRPLVLRSGGLVLAMMALCFAQKACECVYVQIAESATGQARRDFLEQPAVTVGVEERSERAVAGIIGRAAADAILASLSGKPRAVFRYRDKGLMATIGRHAAVAQLRHGPIWRGTIGWLAWLGLHLVYLVGFRNRVVVLVNWAWRYLDWPSGPRLIVADVDADL